MIRLILIGAVVGVLAGRPVRQIAAPDIREQARAMAEARAPRIAGAADLSAFFSELEARARQNRKITALEVEPGTMAARMVAARLPPGRAAELAGQFARRMAALSAQFDGR